MECGLNIQIMGDCFIGKQFDDDNGFKRFDFSIKDLNTSLSWFILENVFFQDNILFHTCAGHTFR